jgi:hypothetical protein
MTIEVVNPKEESEPGLSFSELQENVLYKLKHSPFGTIYLKTVDGSLIWFEKGRMGNRDTTSLSRFVLAPKGTEVHLIS